MPQAHTRERHREDADVFADARMALDRCLNVPETVHVHVSGGTATLTGTVRIASQALEAETAVGRIRGVRDVINEIVVTQPASATGDEAPVI